MKRFLIGMLLAAGAGFPAGLLDFGVKGGVPVTDAFNTARSGNLSYITNTKRYTVGPTVDLNLPFGLGVEFDALYRRLGYESTANLITVVTHAATTGNAWDFPLLLKLRLGAGPIKPYLAAGPTFRGLTSLKQVQTFFFVPTGQVTTQTSRPAELDNRFTTGFTAAGGLQLGAAVVRISPEIRYTRWGWNSFRNPAGLLKSNPDQVDFLLGLTF